MGGFPNGLLWLPAQQRGTEPGTHGLAVLFSWLHNYFQDIKDGPLPPRATVFIGMSADNQLCPVKALDLLRSRSPTQHGFLFRFRNGTCLTREKLNTIIRALMVRQGVPYASYSSHSFRIGAASSAAAAGIPDWRIQSLGRWSSDCYRQYIRLPEHHTGEVAAILVRAPL